MPIKSGTCRFEKSVRKFPMLVGYARVSTNDQNLALQRDALKAAGCKKLFSDQGISGSIFKRPGLDAALASLQPGDTLLVWKLDRLGRSLPHPVQRISDLGDRGINFRSLSDPINRETSPCPDSETAKSARRESISKCSSPRTALPASRTATVPAPACRRTRSTPGRLSRTRRWRPPLRGPGSRSRGPDYGARVEPRAAMRDAAIIAVTGKSVMTSTPSLCVANY